MTTMDAAQPSLVVVDGDERELTRTAAELRRRYGSDYRIVAESSAVVALARLEAIVATGQAVAVVLAHQWLPELTGEELLARVRDCIHTPSARCSCRGEPGPTLPLPRQSTGLSR